MDLDDALDELYGCAPREFVSRRRELTRSARAADAPGFALDIARARKPTQVAWLLNQWIRRSPTDLDPLLSVADELREAQRRSSAELLRKLSTRRRDVVQTALEHLRSFATEIGAGMSTTVEREAVQTLRAAIGDEQVADLLRRGRLVTAMEYSGFGPAGLVALADSPGPADEATAEVPEPSSTAEEGSTADRAAEIDAARALLDRHTADVDSATVELDSAQRSVDDAERAATDLAGRVARMRAELDRAEQEQRFAQRAAETARSQRDEAATALESASDARSRAQQRLDDLRLDDLSGDADRD